MALGYGTSRGAAVVVGGGGGTDENGDARAEIATWASGVRCAAGQVDAVRLHVWRATVRTACAH